MLAWHIHSRVTRERVKHLTFGPYVTCLARLHGLVINSSDEALPDVTSFGATLLRNMRFPRPAPAAANDEEAGPANPPPDPLLQ